MNDPVHRCSEDGFCVKAQRFKNTMTSSSLLQIPWSHPTEQLSSSALLNSGADLENFGQGWPGWGTESERGGTFETHVKVN